MRRSIEPDEVAAAVTVGVVVGPGRRELPGAPLRGERGRGCHAATRVHDPHDVVAVGHLPDEIGDAVAVEVTGGLHDDIRTAAETDLRFGRAVGIHIPEHHGPLRGASAGIPPDEIRDVVAVEVPHRVQNPAVAGECSLPADGPRGVVRPERVRAVGHVVPDHVLDAVPVEIDRGAGHGRGPGGKPDRHARSIEHRAVEFRGHERPCVGVADRVLVLAEAVGGVVQEDRRRAGRVDGALERRIVEELRVGAVDRLEIGEDRARVLGVPLRGIVPGRGGLRVGDGRGAHPVERDAAAEGLPDLVLEQPLVSARCIRLRPDVECIGERPARRLREVICIEPVGERVLGAVGRA